MEHALSTLMVVWGLIGLVTLWVAANALADFGARNSDTGITPRDAIHTRATNSARF